MSQWAVVKDGINKTFTKIHMDEIKAHDEAKRLCRLENKPFLVVRITGRYSIPNHSELARKLFRELLDIDISINYSKSEEEEAIECIAKTITQAFLDGRKSGIEECIKSVHSDTQPWASSRLKNLMREEK